MPVKRTRLTRQQQATYLARAQELQAARLDCGIPEEWQENSRSLDIFVAPREGNLLCELSTGVTACAIYVELVSLSSNVILENSTIASEWDSELIVLCGDQRGLYRVGTAFEFTEEEVLNHRIENGLRFHHRGGVAKGWIVATGRKLIPDKYRSQVITKLSLTFTDQFGHDHSVQAEATLERSPRLRDTAPRVRKSQELFELVPENEIGVRETAESALKPQGHAATRTYAGGRELGGTRRWDVNVHADTGIVDSFPPASGQPKALLAVKNGADCETNPTKPMFSVLPIPEGFGKTEWGGDLAPSATCDKE